MTKVRRNHEKLLRVFPHVSTDDLCLDTGLELRKQYLCFLQLPCYVCLTEQPSTHFLKVCKVKKTFPRLNWSNFFIGILIEQCRRNEKKKDNSCTSAAYYILISASCNPLHGNIYIGTIWSSSIGCCYFIVQSQGMAVYKPIHFFLYFGLSCKVSGL